MSPDIPVRFRGENRSALAAARGTDGAIAQVRRSAVRNNQAVASSSVATARAHEHAMMRVRTVTSTATAGFATLRRGALAVIRPIGLVGGAVAALATVTGFRFNMMREQATIAFTTMLDSGQKARAFLDQLAKFAARTPFEFPDLVRASQRLLAVGFAAEDVLPTVNAVGNAVAGMGGSPELIDQTIRALGQVQAKGRLMAEEMMQFTEAGTFGWRALARELGVSVPRAMEMVTAGQVSANEALQAFVRNSNREFGGMMDKQSETVGGMWSTFKDTFGIIMGGVLTPFYEDTRRLLKRTLGEIGTEEFEQRASRMGQAFHDRVAPPVKAFIADFRRNWPEIREGLEGGAKFALSFASALGETALMANSLADAIGGWDRAFALILAGTIALRIGAIRRQLLLTNAAQVIVANQSVRTAGAVVASTGAMAAGVGRVRRNVRLLSLGFGGLPGAVAAAVVLSIPYLDDLERKLESIVNKLPGGVQDILGRFPDESLLGRIADDDEEPPGVDWRGHGPRDRRPADPAKRRSRPRRRRATPDYGPGGVPDYGGGDTGGPGTGGTRSGGPGSGGRPTVELGTAHVAPGADRPGVATKPHVITFVRRIAAIYGASLTITTGTQHREMTTTGNVSDHWSGDAADIAMRGEALTRLGQAALIAAGADPAWARNQTGGAYRIGGVQIIFNSMVGGNHFNHLHVGLKSLPASLRGKIGGRDQTVQPAEDALAPEEDFVSPAERRPATRRAAAFGRAAGRVAPEAGRRALQTSLRAIRKEIREALTDEDLEIAERKLERFKERLDNALKLTREIRTARTSLGRLREVIRRLPADLQGDLMARVRTIGAVLSKNVITAADISRVKGMLETLNDAIDSALDKVRERVDLARDHLQDIWGSFADKALEVFDAQTDELIKKARAPFEALTPAERALEDLRRRRSQASRESEMADAQSELAFALRVGDPDLIRRAHERIAAIELDAEEARLSALAQQERDAAEAAADLEEKRIRDERAYLRERFAARLQETLNGLLAEGATYDQAMQTLLGLLGEYGINFESAGFLVGAAFAHGFTTAVQAAADAASTILGVVGDLARATGASSGSPLAAIVEDLIGRLAGSRNARLPQAQRGLYMARPTVVQTHGDEAVLPLSDPRAMRRIVEALGGVGEAYAPTYNFHWPNYVGPRDELERQMLAALERVDRRNGGIHIRATRQ